MPTNPKPTQLPEFASGDNAAILAPIPGKKALGFVAGEAPPAGWLNWLFYRTYQWLLYLDTLFDTLRATVLEWTARQTYRAGLVARSRDSGGVAVPGVPGLEVTEGGSVEGGLSVTGGLTVDTVDTTGAVTVGGDVTTTGDINAANLLLDGNANVGGGVNATGAVTGASATFTGDVTGVNADFTGDLGVTGEASVGSLASAGAISASSATVSGDVTAGSVSTSGDVAVGGALSAANVLKAYGKVSVLSGVVTVDSGYNIASATVATSAGQPSIRITFTNALPHSHYAVTANASAISQGGYGVAIAAQATTTVDLRVFYTDDNTAVPNPLTVTVYFTVASAP